MLRKIGIAVLLLLSVPALAIAWLQLDLWRRTNTFHQKLTLEVATPDGPRSGSSVVEVSKWHAKLVLGFPGGLYETAIEGEAAVVEVAPGKYLFALLTESTKYLAQKVFAEELDLDDRYNRPKFEVWSRRLAALRATREVPRKHTPLLVTFADLKDPTSIKRVDPLDLSASFGPGVALTRITLSLTDERVTEGRVEDVLPWVKTIGRVTLDGRRFSTIKAENRLANDLTQLNFVWRQR